MGSEKGNKDFQTDANDMSADSSSDCDVNSVDDEADRSTPRTSPKRRRTIAGHVDLELPDGDPCTHHRRPSEAYPTASMRYDRKKEDNLFPPTKKYRYYPVTCEYCRRRFQPNKLKAHQEKRHFGGGGGGKKAPRRAQSAAMARVQQESQKQGPSKSPGAMPRRLQICYICGRMYGSKSLALHEPKCLEKWRIQNDQLPPNLRAPEPVKPKPIARVAEDKSYSLPAFDPTAEAAFQSHLRTLIPCTHCSRTFSPDRIQRHIECCIERPRTRECATPAGGEMRRRR